MPVSVVSQPYNIRQLQPVIGNCMLPQSVIRSYYLHTCATRHRVSNTGRSSTYKYKYIYIADRKKSLKILIVSSLFNHGKN